MEIFRKYGEATTILFPLVDAGAVDFEQTPVSFVAADTQISKNEAAFANTGSTPAHEGNGMYSLALTATEMQAARIMITCIDAATKAWEDQSALIATFGHASAQYAFDLDQAFTFTSGAVDADVERWRGGIPAALTSQLVQAHMKETAALAITSSSFLIGAINAAAIATDAIGADELAGTAVTEIVDLMMRVATSTIEAAAGGVPDDRTLYGLIAGHMHKRTRSATEIVLYESDDSTPLVTIPIIENAGLKAVTEIDPPA